MNERVKWDSWAYHETIGRQRFMLSAKQQSAVKVKVKVGNIRVFVKITYLPSADDWFVTNLLSTNNYLFLGLSLEFD